MIFNASSSNKSQDNKYSRLCITCSLASTMSNAFLVVAGTCGIGKYQGGNRHGSDYLDSITMNRYSGPSWLKIQ